MHTTPATTSSVNTPTSAAATLLSDTEISAQSVLATTALEDVVTYLKAGELPVWAMRQTSAMLAALSIQLKLRADAESTRRDDRA